MVKFRLASYLIKPSLDSSPDQLGPGLGGISSKSTVLSQLLAIFVEATSPDALLIMRVLGSHGLSPPEESKHMFVP